MTSSDQTALPADAKARAAARVGTSLDPAELAPGRPRGLRVGFACAEFNGGITDRLLTAALDELDAAGVRLGDVVVAWVPGAFELPLVARGWPPSGGWTPWSPSVRSSGATPATTTSWPASAPRACSGSSSTPACPWSSAC